MTVNLTPNPELRSQTTALIAASRLITIATAEDSLAASEWLARVQKLRRWVTGIYKDARSPLVTAQKQLIAQEKALLDPLAVAERTVMAEILVFTTAQAEAHRALESATVDAVLAGETPAALLPPAEAMTEGMSTRTTYSHEVTDLRALVLAVAGQLLLDAPATRSQKAWLIATCQPTTQATLALLEPSASALNNLARALRADLAVPGVQVLTHTTLVARS